MVRLRLIIVVVVGGVIELEFQTGHVYNKGIP